MTQTKTAPPPEWVVEEDVRLQGTTEESARALGELRWTWCSKSDGAAKARKGAPRSGQTTFANAVGVSQGVISDYVNAYEKYRPGDNFLDCLQAVKYRKGDAGVLAATAVGKVNQTEANQPRSYKAVFRDFLFSREADQVETAIEVALTADPEADIEVVAENTARQLKQVREDAQRETEQVVKDIISRAGSPDVETEPVGVEYGALIMSLDSINGALTNAVSLLNKNHRFTDDQKAKLTRRYQKAVKGFEALGMAFDALDTDVDALIGALTEGK